MAYGIKQTMPPAWYRIKNHIVDVLNHAELMQANYRENPSLSNWERYVSAVVTAYLKLRAKIYIVERKSNYNDKYKQLDAIREYYFDIGSVPPEKAQVWAEYLELLQDLAEDTGLTKVSVEDENIDELWRENL